MPAVACTLRLPYPPWLLLLARVVWRLLMTQRIDRVELCSTLSRPDTKNDANKRTESECRCRSLGSNHSLPTGKFRKQRCSRCACRESKEATEQTKRCRFNEKL